MNSTTDPKQLSYLHNAIEALEKQDPFLFSPYFHDAAGVWELKADSKVGP
jgi:hypothetical protein